MHYKPFAGKGYRSKGSTSKNNKLRPLLRRRPTVTGVNYFYCPKMLTAIDDIPPGKEVELLTLPRNKKDKFVMVSYDAQEFRIFWEDLRA